MEPEEKSELENRYFLPLSVQYRDDTQNKSITENGKTETELKVSVLSHAINMEIRSGTTIDISDCFERMLRLYSEDEKSFNPILQAIYQVVKDFSQKQFPRSSNLVLTAGWAELLIDLLFSKTWNKITISNALLCLKLYSRILCEGDIVRRLWQTLLTNNAKRDSVAITSTTVLIQFFDEFSAVINDFKHNPEVEKFVFKLLQSDGREECKAALYLMKKLNSHNDAIIKNFWISYITVLENLEENQSHLILPSLERLKENLLKQVNLQIWLNIIFIKILSHQNILVIRWGLVYILETFTCADISSNVLLQFVKACNHTNLYNPESCYLPAESIHNFLSGSLDRFMGIMSEVNLKCVPLHFWLAGTHKCKPNSTLYSYELVLKIAARIRLLQNPFIRLKSIELFEDIFYEAICKMTLSEYIVLVESLYNVSDPFINFKIFCCKLKPCFENGIEIPLTERFYEIVTNNLYGEFTPIDSHLKYMQAIVNTEGQPNTTQSKLLNNLADNLKNIDYSYKGAPNWIPQMLVWESDDTKVVRNTCQSFLGLNLDNIVAVPFEILMLKLTSVLSCGGHTVAFVRKKCTDFFVKEYLTNFSDLQIYNVKVEDLLSTGSHKTFLKLSQLLANNKDKVDASILDEFLMVLKRFSRMPSLCYIVTTNLLRYLVNIYPSCQLEAYANQVLCTDLENVGICVAVLNSGVVLKKETYITGIMIGDAYFGDARTEELYLFKLGKMQCTPLQQIRLQYVLHMPDDYTNAILNELIGVHKSLSIKKPRYFENSMEHRLKMRIAKAILLKVHSNAEFWNEALLDLLLNHNNQLNINYIYELLVAKCAPSDELILEKLNEVTKYTPSQQVSLISIVHCYSFLNWRTLSKENLYTIVNKLLPLTMGPHFQTRSYAQLVIYNILDKSNTASNTEPLLSNMQEAIALAVGQQLKELLNDVRVLLPFIYISDPIDFYDIIMYITMAPADEYFSNSDFSKYEASKYIFSQKKNRFAKDAPTPAQISYPRTNLTNMQRKMNPENDLYAEGSYMVSETATDFEMIVVASLIDKNPNLGGIARTCEVLGIRNLVLSSRLLVEKEDFRSVSMTAEKNLNIIEVRPANLPEFFKEKEADGFKIIGAEQTVDSVNITSFEFPRKCVLVLGHEKEGIPSNILGFLDYTIEIPQFGVLRSLNVHVTGALFMWEYCKQHIVGNSSTTTYTQKNASDQQ